MNASPACFGLQGRVALRRDLRGQKVPLSFNQKLSPLPKQKKLTRGVKCEYSLR